MDRYRCYVDTVEAGLAGPRVFQDTLCRTEIGVSTQEIHIPEAVVASITRANYRGLSELLSPHLNVKDRRFLLRC